MSHITTYNHTASNIAFDPKWPTLSTFRSPIYQIMFFKHNFWQDGKLLDLAWPQHPHFFLMGVLIFCILL